ncbi:universal stress protein [Kribbella kalugense]|uniref:Universal stress protein family protein n=1 Tax=Kribbella kalugense TaxID=2512221 RepID=A0A4R7ZV69_9ACTN|nr:universal stress protein [Kribbella kalugense]TDW21997.1 universal stress protein family protein [Kribbella kalugense]
MKLFRSWQGALPDARSDSRPAEVDGGPVIVLVDERGAEPDALDWAAAEAAERGSELRIVHAFRWPRVSDPLGNSTIDLRAREGAEAIVAEAVRRARRIAPSLRITTAVHPARPVPALVAEARRSELALVVLSHNSKFERTLARRLVRRTTASLAVIGLSPRASIGPSAGRVVVAGETSAAIEFGFRSARRRGIGLTIVHPSLDEAAHIRQTAYPEVDVRWVFAAGAVGSAVLAESTAAALTVLGANRRHTLYDVLRLARGPVVVAPAR